MVLTALSSRSIRRAQAGFSLAEMLLVVVLMMLFAGSAVISMAPLWKSAPLDEGVGRLEGLLRYARAEAAQHGRRVRLQVCHPGPSADGLAIESPAVQVQWEPEPLSQPGVFVQNEATAAMAQSLNELVRVEGVRHLDAPTAGGPTDPQWEKESAASNATTANFGASTEATSEPAAESEPPDANSFPPITFYPDGSSDSAEILVGVFDSSDSRRMIVRWDGLSGTAAHTISRAEGSVGGDLGAAGSAHPLEPSSVADSAMGPVSP